MVSIIVPVYNCIATLGRCVDSLLAQTYGAIEVILVDDGSKDESGKLCDEYAKKDGRIRVIHKENGGVSSARNAGLDSAGGEYVLFCDSDDYADPDWCRCLVSAAEGNGDLMPVCNFYRVYKSGTTINQEEKCSFLHSEIGEEDVFSLYPLELLGTPWNKLFKNNVIQKRRLRYDTSLSLGEDLVFNLEYIDCAVSGVCFIDRPLYYYYLGNGESLSAKYYPDLYGIYEKVFSRLGECLKKYDGAFDKYEKQYWSSCFFAIDRVFRNTFSKKDKRTTREKWKYNSKVFKEELFQNAKKRIAKGEINSLQYAALRSNSFYIYWSAVELTERLSRLRHKRKG